jgi:hypothetical protein
MDTDIPVYLGPGDNTVALGRILPPDVQPVGTTRGRLIGGGPLVTFRGAYRRVSAVIVDTMQDADIILSWFARRPAA